MSDCQHDLAIGQGNICCKCGKELVFFKALASLANANISRPLLKLTEVLKEAKIPMQKLAKQLRKLEVAK
jgi:hypothetical protein